MIKTATDPVGWFFDFIVQPTVQEFRDNSIEVRRGMLAALVVSSLADHIYHGRPAQQTDGKQPGDYRSALAKESASFALVRDVADATKHARLDRKSAAITQLDAVQSLAPTLTDRAGNVITNRAECPIHVREVVVVVLPSGDNKDLIWLIEDALVFLCSKIQPSNLSS